MIDSSIGTRIKKQRQELGMSAMDAAAAIGVNLNTLYSWERGSSCPAAKMLPKIAEGLGTTQASLLGEEDVNDGDFAECIGARMKLRRETIKISAMQAAAAMDVNLNTLYSWERGASTPPLGKISKIAEALKTYPAFLLGMDQPQPITPAPTPAAADDEEDFPTDVWGSIDSLMRDRDYETEEMAAVLEKGEDYANNLTHGNITPTLLDALRLAMWFGVTLDELVDRASIEAGGVDDPAPQAPAAPAPAQPAPPARGPRVF